MINSIEWIVFGDSIGLGVAQAAGLPCNCKIGRQPHEVLAEIERTHEAFLYSRNVILSSGLSNNPDGRVYVERQVQALHSIGTASIVLLGVGPSVRDGTNEWLAALAERSGSAVIFAGPLRNTRPDGVHPWSYGQLVDQIEAALSAAVSA